MGHRHRVDAGFLQDSFIVFVTRDVSGGGFVDPACAGTVGGWTHRQDPRRMASTPHQLATSGPQSPAALFAARLGAVATNDPRQVTELVDTLLAAAREARASDVHLTPAAEGLDMSWRIDGLIQPVARFDREIAPNIAARLKVLAELLTYKTDVPQEGRIRAETSGVETRVSTFPTLFGEQVAVRLFVGGGRYQRLADLGLDPVLTERLATMLGERGGALVVTGPAGSGKTTTVYAALRELATDASGGRSLMSIEDPIESVIPGVAQAPVRAAVGFDYETALRSLLRQDPDVILVGEIRDRGTAEKVFQASLTGHLVLTTFHAGSAAGAITAALRHGDRTLPAPQWTARHPLSATRPQALRLSTAIDDGRRASRAAGGDLAPTPRLRTLLGNRILRSPAARRAAGAGRAGRVARGADTGGIE
ncbi:MAG: ATPase, T2SS/T4P/T4SS family [Planctomycetaceae bacterium]